MMTYVSGWKELEKKSKKLFKDQKIKIDPILKYRRTKESEVFVDTTQIRAGKRRLALTIWLTIRLHGSIRTRYVLEKGCQRTEY